MNYFELDCKIVPFEATISEILIAELAELGYESFVENDNGLLAYITEDLFNAELLSSLTIASNPEHEITFSHKLIEQENWNETWEKNYFEPILIDNQCVIRSTFHQEFPEVKYQITIDPKMAFGTGHHETTSLMIKEILHHDVEGKTILDMGCGTGILAILSSMRGAKDITAVDIDEWSYRNTLENIELNATWNIHVMHGDISIIEDRKYDIIFANINKNVLLNDIPQYAKNLHKGAFLFLSGFYVTDFEDIDNIARKSDFELIKMEENNKWAMLKYFKS